MATAYTRFHNLIPHEISVLLPKDVFIDDIQIGITTELEQPGSQYVTATAMVVPGVLPQIWWCAYGVRSTY